MSTNKVSISTTVNWLRSLFERNSASRIEVSANASLINEVESKDNAVSDQNVTEGELAEWIDMETRKRARLLVNQTYHPHEDDIKDEILDWINCHKSKLAESIKNRE